MTSEIVSFAHASFVRNFLVAFILSRFIIAALHFIFMCSLKLSSESSYAPRYLVIPVPFITSSLIFSLFVMHFSSCLGLSKYINSVLLLFIFSHTWSIQVLISCNDSSMILMVSSSSLWSSLLDLKVFLMLWSSANPFSVSWSTTSSMVEA